MKQRTLPILFVCLLIGTVLAYVVPDTRADATGNNFMVPALARMIFWHLPCALSTSLFIIAAPFFAYRYLRTQDIVWDARSEAANEMALLMAVLTLVTGMLFSQMQWGIYWNWDPRQTSFLIATLFIAAYFVLRAAIDDPEKRASHSSAYSLAALLPIVFLIFVFPRLVTTLHPDVVRNGGLDPTYRSVFLYLFVTVLAISIYIYRMRVRLSILDRRLEEFHAELADRDHPTTARVVRPVPISESDRQEGPRP